jgi:hypothetical protein
VPEWGAEPRETIIARAQVYVGLIHWSFVIFHFSFLILNDFNDCAASSLPNGK